MGWRKLFETQDTIAYEKKKKELDIRIEARSRENAAWDVYKIYHPKQVRKKKKDLNLIQEFNTATKSEAVTLMKKLMEEKDLDIQTIKEKKPEHQDTLQLELKREYKEEYLEKWVFSLDNFQHENILFVRFDAEIHMDVVLNEIYIGTEDAIVQRIIERLGIRSINPQLNITIYYFSKQKRIQEKKDLPEKLLLARLEMELLPPDDEHS